MNDFIKYCQEIVRIPSISGQEKAVAELIQARMKSLGYDQAWIDEKGNVLGLIEGKGDRTIMLDGHMDTVGVGDTTAWTVDPFCGTMDKGRIYGRGTSDMKCALMAMVYGAADLIPQKEVLGGRVLVAGTVCEEEFEGVAQGHILDRFSPDLVIIGEASELTVKIGQRGRAEVVVETYGRSAHSSNPSAGINAVKKMTQLLSAIESMILSEDASLGAAIIEVTDIRSEPYPGTSVIPSYCRATLDRRTLPGETEETVLASIQKIINDLTAQDPEFSSKVYLAQAKQMCYTGDSIEAKRFFPAWRFEVETPFVQNALSALKAAGIPTGISFYSFCTNGSQSAGFRGIPTLGFGPSRENLAHVADEFVEIDQLQKARIGYRAIAAHALAEF